MNRASRRVFWIGLAAGVLLGGLAAGILVARHYNRMLAEWYWLQIFEQAHVALEVRSGDGSELAARIVSELPSQVLAVDSDFSRAANREAALWHVRELYELSGTPVPESISPLLDKLPQEHPPRCQRRPAAETSNTAARGEDPGRTKTGR